MLEIWNGQQSSFLEYNGRSENHELNGKIQETQVKQVGVCGYVGLAGLYINEHAINKNIKFLNYLGLQNENDTNVFKKPIKIFCVEFRVSEINVELPL